jgi:thiol-disulfide isomerase/thioredoxin
MSSLRILVSAGLFLVAVVARAEVKVGDAFPPLAPAGLVSVAGGEPALAGKIALVDFWASWCQPCKLSFPVYAKLHRDYAVRGLAIVAIGPAEKWDSTAKALAFVKKQAPPFVVLRDVQDKFVPAFDVKTWPTSYLLDRTGRVRFVHSGFHDDTEKELRREIETLLAEKNSSAP